MTRKSFLQGAVILAAAGVFIKLLGAAFRIPLGNMIGDLGMSYYQTASHVYVVLLIIANTGIPVAISKMVSERVAIGNYHEANRVFKISFVLLLCIGLFSSSACFFGAKLIPRFVSVPEAVYSMQALAPALLIVSMMAAFRGYFQGMQDMRLTAASQSVEQLFRVVCGLLLAYYFLGVKLEYAAAGAAFGASCGGIAGIITAIVIYSRNRARLKLKIEGSKIDERARASDILLRIVVISLPITFGSAIMPIMNLIDLFMVVNILESSGFTGAEAKGLFGQLAGFVGSLINFPQVMAQAVAMSLVPAISMAHKQKDDAFMSVNIKLGVRCAMIIGLPCAFGFITLSKEIMLLFYPLQRQSALSAAEILFVMGIGVVFLSLFQTLTGILQGVGKQLIPARNLAVGALFKLFISYIFISIPRINVKGAAIGTISAYAVASALNMAAMKKYTKVKLDIALTFGKPLLSAITMSALVWVCCRILGALLGNAAATLLSIAAGVLIYFFMIFKLKAITKEELRKLPKGDKLVKIIDKFVK